MKIQINENITLDVSEPSELLELMSDDEKVELIESLSCCDAVIKHVADQIIHGCTENGRSGWKGYSATPSTPLDVAVRDVANISGEIAKKEIASLVNLVKAKEKTAQHFADLYHQAAGHKQ